MRKEDGFAIIETLEKGMAGARIDPLVATMGVSQKEFATILGVAERTLHRLRHAPTLERSTAERIILMEQLVAHGLDVFDGNSAAFIRWLHHPLGELNRLPPLHWLTTVTGIGLVDDVLTRIDYGIYV